MKFSITREEQIPFTNTDGTVMQMVQYKIWVTAFQDDWQTVEEMQRELDKVFEDEREKLSWQVPLLKIKERRIQFILDQVKRLTPDKYNSILLWAKNIK